MSASQTRRLARGGLKGFWGLSLLVTLVASFLGASSGGGSSATYTASGSSVSSNVSEVMDSFYNLAPAGQTLVLSVVGVMAVISFLYLLLVLILGGAVNLGLKQYNINLIRRDASPSFGMLFCRFNIFIKALLLQLAMFLFIFLWSLLLIIPGIVASYRYAMAPYLLAQNPEMGVMEAIDRSKQMMRGYKWRLFCLHLSFIGWIFLGFLSCGIGLLWVNPYISAAEAAFYLQVSGQIPLGGAQNYGAVPPAAG